MLSDFGLVLRGTSWKTTSHKDHLEVCLPNNRLLSGLYWDVVFHENYSISKNFSKEILQKNASASQTILKYEKRSCLH